MFLAFSCKHSAHRAETKIRRVWSVLAAAAILGFVGQCVGEEDKSAKAKEGQNAKASWKTVNLPLATLRIPPNFDCTFWTGIDSVGAELKAKDKSLLITHIAESWSSDSDDKTTYLAKGVGKSRRGKFDYFYEKRDDGNWVTVTYQEARCVLYARVSGDKQYQLVLEIAKTLGPEFIVPEERRAVMRLRKYSYVVIDPSGHAREIYSTDFKRRQLNDWVGLKELKKLVFTNYLAPWNPTNELSDDDLMRLCGISSLEELSLPKSPKITDAGFRNFGNLKNLVYLNIEKIGITNAGLVNVAKAKRLRDLHLDINLQITNQGLAHLAGLTELGNLNLYDSKVDGNGLVHLKTHHKLETLGLADLNVRSGDLKHLAPLEQLTSLNLVGTPIDDEGIVWLKQLSKLENLYLDGTKISEKGIVELQTALPRCKIKSDYSRATEKP